MRIPPRPELVERYLRVGVTERDLARRIEVTRAG